MKALKITLFLSVIAAFSPHAGNSQDQFQFLIWGPADEEAHSIIQTRDGGYAIAGHTRNFGAGNSDMYVIKINNAGLIEWTVTAGGPHNDYAYNIIQTYDGGYIVGGDTRSFPYNGNNIYILKLDSAGSVQWEKVISGFAAGSFSNDFFSSIIETNDSAFVISAGTSNLDAGFSGLQIFKLNRNGTVLWNRVLRGGVGRHIIQTSDNGFALGGHVNNSMGITKLDENGNVQWSRAVGGVPQDAALSIIQSSDGGFVLAGDGLSFSASGNMYIAKFDSAGSLQWTRYVGGSSIRTIAREIVQTYDGGYAVGGNRRVAGGQFYAFLVKLDSNGEVQWSRIFGTDLWNEFCRSMKQTSDSGFIMAGYRNTGFSSDVYIIKLDKEANTCANMTNVVSVNGTGGMVTMTNPTSIFPGYIVTEPQSTKSSGGNFVTLCGLVGTGGTGNSELPESFELAQNYPNPFNPSTVISYSLPVNSNVTLKVFDILGKEVVTLVDENQNAGNYNVEWNALEFSSGIYFYQIETKEYSKIKKMILLK
jgi:hypothetical protein